MIRLLRIFLFCGLLSIPSFLSAQAKPSTDHELFLTAVELYKQEQYQNAYQLFNGFGKELPSSLRQWVASYKLLCEMALEDPAVENKVVHWEQEYPSAPLKHTVFFTLGNYFSNKEQFKDALQAYEKVNEKKLSSTDRASFLFRMGYACMQTGNADRAMNYFTRTEEAPGKESYKWGAVYYKAYLYYAQSNFEQAIPLLERVMEVPQYAELSKTYLLQALFYSKQYEQVILTGVPLYQHADRVLRTTLAKTLSEAYFALDRAEEARTFFDDYLEEVASLTITDRYYSGILYFKLEDFALAADQLSLVGERKDSLGQNALYHLGEAYIKLHNKVDAREAFKKASAMHYDPLIKEDAFFNYAKLSFDLNSDVQVLSAYRKEYPNSPKLDEIQNYIAANYFINQDYAMAVEALSALRNPTKENLRDLEKAAYLRGIQLYKTGSFREAERYFEQAKEPYWVAECQYRSNQYQKAIRTWTRFIRESGSFAHPQEYRTSHYNIAYAYFKSKEYVAAEEWFHKYLRLGKSDMNLVADTYLRLGDCSFAQYAHAQATVEYQNALNHRTVAPDYALYQIAMAQGVLNEDSEKIVTLDRLMNDYPGSAFFSAALFEQGRTFVQTNQYKKAEERFSTILSFATHSAFHAKALVELGLIRINMKRPNEALGYYKEVLKRFPDSPDAANAMAGIENIYLARNDSKGFFEYMESLGIDSGKSPGEKEMMVFSSAEQLYLNHTHAAAVTALLNFIKDYPESSKIPAAQFYLGECYMKLGKMQLAADAYLVVMTSPSGSFTELATKHYAAIQFDLEQYANAVDAYMSLGDIAQIDNNRLEALKGLMWSFYKNKQYRNAIVQSNKVLENKTFDKNVQTDATYIIAQSHLALGEREQALTLLEELSKESHTATGAEAFYLLCKDAFDLGNFDTAETMIYNFADSDTPQEYWIARAFILLGDIFAERNEWVQAKATYESIQKGYKPDKPDDIEQLVMVRLKKCEEALP
ncbi:MAG: tetratricopeptide repeat protein [Bacteroidales bacterium]|nr:tetratricopeptide repeat protein [Bacteroidales bacterium]